MFIEYYYVWAISFQITFYVGFNTKITLVVHPHPFPPPSEGEGEGGGGIFMIRGAPWGQECLI